MQVRYEAYWLVRKSSPLTIIYLQALLWMLSAADRSSGRIKYSPRKSRRGWRQSEGTSRSVCMAGIWFKVMLSLSGISIWMMQSLSPMIPAINARASECLFLPRWICSRLALRNLFSHYFRYPYFIRR
ncbi:hypothetical protein GIB67_035068 [Kingdonia uniflora]|uniref:Uncharacterized protein n=1 Tax=Kingdonia uniflora TaxID=39325 RepID=A0A7J7L1Q5_9MAGN|nr:hypothetical protein GIB67_035068 [Kingdonia uniflora]